MDSIKPLEAFARPRHGAFAPGLLADAARQLDPARVAISALDGGVHVRCIWYGDLDAVYEALRAHGAGDLLWDEPKIEYRTEHVPLPTTRREIILEPVMLTTVAAPQDFMGSVLGDLSGRRGLIVGMGDQDERTKTAAAEVPLAELRGYSETLKRLTDGRGVVTVEFKHFAEAPRDDPDPREPMSVALRA
jgi:hypothetical protein